MFQCLSPLAILGRVFGLGFAIFAFACSPAFAVEDSSSPSSADDSCEEVLHQAITAADWLKFEWLITEPANQKISLHLYTPETELLVDLLAKRTPINPEIRAAATRSVYGHLNRGTPLNQRLDFEGDARDFAGRLLQQLAYEGLVQKRDRSGNAQLIDWVDTAVHIQAIGEDPRSHMTAAEKTEVHEILSMPDFDSQLEKNSRQFRRLIYLLADVAPVTRQERRERLVRAYDEAFASIVFKTGFSNAEDFAKALLESLHQERRLATDSRPATEDEITHLLNVFE